MKKRFITIQQSPHDTRAMCICPAKKVNDFFVNEFLEYQEELKYLFEVYTDEEIEIALNKIFNEPERKRVKMFYCPGGFNYEKMSAPFKLMMKIFVKTLKAKKDKTEVERAMIKMISSSYDISDKKYIEPVLQCLKN